MSMQRGAGDLSFGVFTVQMLSMQGETFAVILQEEGGASLQINSLHVEGAGAETVEAITLGRRYEVHLHEVG